MTSVHPGLRILGVSSRLKTLLVLLGFVLGAGILFDGSGDGAHGSQRVAADATPSTTSPAAHSGYAWPPTTTTWTTVPPPRSFDLVATGDVLLHSPLWEQASVDAAAQGRPGYDFAPMLAGVEPLVSQADVAICHLETPLAPPGGPYSSYPSFSVPAEIAPALAEVGYDACTTASNHIYDQGADGVDRTLDGLDAAGIRHAGAARNPEEAAAVTMLDVGGAKVALLSYTYGFNGIPAPNGQTWRSNPIDEAAILGEASTARQRGADIVILALHWGDEYRHEPNAQQSHLASRLIRSPDIDLVLGHHAHVVQPVEMIDDEWVVYGMGNQIAHQASLGAASAEGLLVRFTFTEEAGGWTVTAAEFAPLLMEQTRSPMRLLDVGGMLADPSVDAALQQRLQEAWDRTTGIVHQRGAGRAGLTPIQR